VSALPPGRIVQVVPQTRSRHDGVSAFAAALADRFAEGGVASELCEAFAHHEDAGTSAGGRSRALSSLTPRDAVLVHYVGYGYHPRGIPRPLVEVVETLQASQGARRVGVVFHEVYASGPPWRSSFWLLPLQRRIARRLLRLAGTSATSLPLYRALLGRLAPGREVELLAIPSTVGEPESVPGWADRRNAMVVFGTCAVRARAYQQERQALAAAVAAAGVEEVLDLGDGEVAPAAIGGVPVRRRGRLAAGEVSRLMLSARSGFVAYPPDFLGKSTVFAGYAAHGLAPVVAWSGRQGRDAGPGDTWVRATASGLDPGAGGLAAAARAARESYPARALARHADYWRQRLAPL
jgi:hypothetical protein